VTALASVQDLTSYLTKMWQLLMLQLTNCTTLTTSHYLKTNTVNIILKI